MGGSLALDQRDGETGKAFRLTLRGRSTGADYAGCMSRGAIVDRSRPAFGAGLAGGGIAVLGARAP